eukprot:7281560-Prymnesium_polylepis.2
MLSRFRSTLLHHSFSAPSRRAILAHTIQEGDGQKSLREQSEVLDARVHRDDVVDVASLLTYPFRRYSMVV